VLAGQFGALFTQRPCELNRLDLSSHFIRQVVDADGRNERCIDQLEIKTGHLVEAWAKNDRHVQIGCGGRVYERNPKRPRNCIGRLEAVLAMQGLGRNRASPFLRGYGWRTSGTGSGPN